MNINLFWFTLISIMYYSINILYLPVLYSRNNFIQFFIGIKFIYLKYILLISLIAIPDITDFLCIYWIYQ